MPSALAISVGPEALGFHFVHLRGIDRGGPALVDPAALALAMHHFGAIRRRSPTELLPYAVPFAAGQRRTKMSLASRLLSSVMDTRPINAFRNAML